MSIELPQLGRDGRILEGIVTTRNEGGSVNISPMGPIVDTQLQRLVFRPYQTSTTYQNLRREGSGVFHVTDDVWLFAQSAVGQPEPLPKLDGLRLVEACRWVCFDVCSIDDSQERTTIVVESVDSGTNRDFFGFNRAKHAVLEAAILATRVHLLTAENLLQELNRLESPVQKTAGIEELRAFAFLREHIQTALESAANARQAP